MFKTFVRALGALLLSLSAATAFAAADANKASQAELDAVKGIGPAMATKILDERKKGAFKDWGDLIDRVSGVGEGNAARFSANGLTVNGSGYGNAATKPAAKKEDKK
jgi:competence protein ComEA